jgi:hypothetical protein
MMRSAVSLAGIVSLSFAVVTTAQTPPAGEIQALRANAALNYLFRYVEPDTISPGYGAAKLKAELKIEGAKELMAEVRTAYEEHERAGMEASSRVCAIRAQLTDADSYAAAWMRRYAEMQTWENARLQKIFDNLSPADQKLVRAKFAATGQDNPGEKFKELEAAYRKTYPKNLAALDQVCKYYGK